MVKRKRDYEIIELPVVKKTIKKYDNFDIIKEREKNKKLLSKRNRRIIAKTFVFGTIFIAFSFVKMRITYDIIDMDMKLQNLNTKIYESQMIVDNLNSTSTTQQNLKEIENLSKQMGFVEERNIKYVSFK